MRLHFGSSAEGPFAALSEDGRILAVARGLDPLAALDEALAQAGRRLPDAKTVAVHAGPSGFSDVRRRVAAANGLAFALRLPLAAVGTKSPEEVAALPDDSFGSAFAAPLYERAPNITKSKKRSPLWKER